MGNNMYLYMVDYKCNDTSEADIKPNGGFLLHDHIYIVEDPFSPKLTQTWGLLL